MRQAVLSESGHSTAVAHGSYSSKCLPIDGFPPPPSSLLPIHPKSHADARDTYGTALAAVRIAHVPAFLELARDMGIVMVPKSQMWPNAPFFMNLKAASGLEGSVSLIYSLMH